MCNNVTQSAASPGFFPGFCPREQIKYSRSGKSLRAFAVAGMAEAENRGLADRKADRARPWKRKTESDVDGGPR